MFPILKSAINENHNRIAAQLASYIVNNYCTKDTIYYCMIKTNIIA